MVGIIIPFGKPLKKISSEQFSLLVDHQSQVRFAPCASWIRLSVTCDDCDLADPMCINCAVITHKS